jgi:hypothetical protein
LVPSAAVRPAVDIPAPPFPAGLTWVNVAPLRMDKQRGRPVLVEFLDVSAPSSLRSLPYLQAWHARYADAGLRVVSVHTPGFASGRDPDVVRAALARLGVEHPVVLDPDFQVWDLYGTEGWPSRYLFGPDQRLVEAHFGEGGYADTERAIQDLLGVDGDLVGPLRPEDAPDALIVVPTADHEGPHDGPYEAGAVWAVVDGRGELRAGDRTVAVPGPGALVVLEHARSTAGTLRLEAGPGVTVLATCFSPGLAPEGAPAPDPAA